MCTMAVSCQTQDSISTIIGDGVYYQGETATIGVCDSFMNGFGTCQNSFRFNVFCGYKRRNIAVRTL